MKKTTKIDAESWLNQHAKKIKLLQWGGAARKKSLFIDIELNRKFSQEFRVVKKKISLNPDIKFGKITENEIKFWLSKNCPHIQIVFWSSASKLPSIFFDNQRNVKFSASFTYLRSKITSNNNFIFSPTKEERRSAAIDVGSIKHLQTGVQKKYGVSNISFHKEILAKRNKSIKSRTAEQIAKTTKKRKETFLVKYGVENAAHLETTKLKRKFTILKRYGVEHQSQIKSVVEKTRLTKIKNGNMVTIGGISLKEIADVKNCSYSQISFINRKYGAGAVKTYEINQTFIEQNIGDVLRRNKIDFKQNKSFINTNIRPDFLLTDNKLAIECDGLYWHSDAKVAKTYHIGKKITYAKEGYPSLFFREDEILMHLPIVESIILNKLKSCSTRIFARKCKKEKIGYKTKFFAENHLMGKGQGRIYALTLNGEIVSAMQVKWKQKKTLTLEVSRFSSQINTSVAGGFSKLLSYVIQEERPSRIITFVDLRYGSGDYLEKIGWRKTSENLSFKWCKNQRSVHRMKFPGNSGYIHGYNKIWDCGQAKFEYLVS